MKNANINKYWKRSFSVRKNEAENLNAKLF